MADIQPAKPLANSHKDSHRPPSSTPPLSNSASPTKRTPSTSPSDSPKLKKAHGRHLPLPPGWEKIKSEQGLYYYWEKKSGKTTWRFPHEEAKQYEHLLTKHLYENVELRNKKSRKSSSPEASEQHQINDSHSNHSGEELSKVQSHRHTSQKPNYENVFLSPSPTTPSPVNRHNYENVNPAHKERKPSETLSVPPPLPDRNYSESELQMSPTPSLPDRIYECGSPSPPPLPDRRYSNSEIELGPELTSRLQSSLARSKTAGELLTSRGSAQNTLQHNVTETGHEYAVIQRKQSREGRISTSPDPGGDGIGELDPPPVPKRVHERFKNLNGSSEEEKKGPEYIKVDVTRDAVPPPLSNPYRDSIAYAIVRLDNSHPDKQEQAHNLRHVHTPPSPYEVPSPSSSLERGLSPSTYEEIEIDVQQQPEADGYMDPQKFKRNQSTQRVTSPLDKTHRASHSLDDGDTQNERESSHTPLITPTENSQSLGSEESGGSSQAEISQDSIFNSNFDYDLPSNSRRLQSINVTLPRVAEPHAGYAKLDLSREAILLRSGVTLRRFDRPSLSSFSDFSTSSREASAQPHDGSESGEESEADTLDGTTEYDDDGGLDPVDKCIKSLETTLGVSMETLDAEPMEEYVKMARAPVGPPKWMEYKRRPHAYERIENSPPDEGQNADPLSLKSVSDLDMEWDESDMSRGTAVAKPVGTGFASTAGSISQPNLLRAPDGKDLQSVFPHLEKPDRVSAKAFNMRKLRLLKHQYEDVEVSEVEGMTVGDVNALTSAVKDSWMEGDKSSAASGEEKLPKGWQRMKDEDGKIYYWHIPTGRTQYNRPTGDEVKRLSLTLDDTMTFNSPPPPKEKAHTFSARYLGFLPVAESELVPGQCVKVVHACIKTMAAAHGEQSSVSEKGKPVFLQIQGMELRWLDPCTNTPTTVQLINRIRVWGIGLENERDFGYVARDVTTKKHQCYLFRCDMPARAVARSLLESHQKQKKLRSPKPKEDTAKTDATPSAGSTQGRSGSVESNGARSVSPEVGDSTKECRVVSAGRVRTSTSPPYQHTPDRYDRIQCTYIGSCATQNGVGMEVLNEAVDKLQASQHRWLDVNVDVATSHIKISDVKTNRVIREHRVRFLCFLGIANDDHFCGYVLDSGERNGEKIFQFHGFRKEPNTDRLCLALHSACQARYQRVLDANPNAATREKVVAKEPVDKKERKASSLFGRLGSFKKVKKSPDDEKLQSFVVQYLGSRIVTKPDGLETVREPVQQLAVPKTTASSVPLHLVEFDVSPTGLSITDPQKKLFARKSFPVKNITYVVRMRNYFAFVAKESGKFHCHVLLETEVDAGTIVGTIQKMLAPDSSKQYKK